MIPRYLQRTTAGHGRPRGYTVREARAEKPTPYPPDWMVLTFELKDPDGQHVARQRAKGLRTKPGRGADEDYL